MWIERRRKRMTIKSDANCKVECMHLHATNIGIVQTPSVIVHLYDAVLLLYMPAMYTFTHGHMLVTATTITTTINIFSIWL